jgi:hypothetical protein
MGKRRNCRLRSSTAIPALSFAVTPSRAFRYPFQKQVDHGEHDEKTDVAAQAQAAHRGQRFLPDYPAQGKYEEKVQGNDRNEIVRKELGKNVGDLFHVYTIPVE